MYAVPAAIAAGCSPLALNPPTLIDNKVVFRAVARIYRLLLAGVTVLLVLASGAQAARPRLPLPPLPVPLPVPLPLPGQPDPAPYGQNDAGGFLNVLPPGEAGVDNVA